MKIEKQEPTEDRSQKDLQPEVDASIHRSFQSRDLFLEETSYFVHLVFFVFFLHSACRLQDGNFEFWYNLSSGVQIQ